mgnify:CR=1 FL=1
MKKIFLFLFTLAVGITTLYANPKHEFRASWMTTGYGLDWPRQKTADAQKAELQQKLDALVAGNHNAVCLQVRSFADAIYKSSYEPWADCLTGTRGQDPGYDPLQFAIEEAHKRGLELHVWVNPFRVTSAGKLSEDDPVWKNAGQWIIKYSNSSFSGQIIDPGYPEARDYVHKVFMEIVNNYDIDGILMDDYFYAYGGTYSEDADSKNKYCYAWKNGQTKPSKDGDNDYVDDWRRANVDSVVCRLYKDLQKTKPWVRFGMGTPGNWSNRDAAASYYGISLPATTAMESYDYLYCNPVEWAKQGWVDYLNPQVYWSTTAKKGDYDILTPWWAKTVCENFSNKLPNGQKVHFFASQGACYVYDNDGMEGYNDGVAEIQRQIDVNRANLSSGYTGSVFFSTSSAILMRNELRESHFKFKALPPAMDWKSKTALAAPTNVKVKDTVMTWDHPTAERFTIYIYPRGSKGIAAKNNAAAASVPTQEELWANFKTAAGLSGLGTLAEIKTGDMVASCKAICTKLTAAEVQKAFSNSSWTWLKDYITEVQNAQKGIAIGSGSIPELTDDLTPPSWRYAIAAFFLQTQYTAWPYSADFTTAGQPSAWGPAYLGEDTGSGNNGDNTSNNTPAPEYLKTVVYGKSCRMDGWGDLSKLTIAIYAYDRFGVEHEAAFYEGNEVYEPKVEIYWELDGGKVDGELPTYVTERYVLPIPLKYGYNFDCWRSVKTTRGQKLTEIPAGWKGTLYAFWKKWPTDVTNITWNDQIQVYDIMGRFVGNELPTDQHGVFIIIQGKNKVKIVL